MQITDFLARRTDSVDRRTDSVDRRTDSVGCRTDSVGCRTDSVGRRTDSVGCRNDSVGCRTDSVGRRTDSVGRRTDFFGRENAHFHRPNREDTPPRQRKPPIFQENPHPQTPFAFTMKAMKSMKKTAGKNPSCNTHPFLPSCLPKKTPAPPLRLCAVARDKNPRISSRNFGLPASTFAERLSLMSSHYRHSAPVRNRFRRNSLSPTSC